MNIRLSVSVLANITLVTALLYKRAARQYLDAVSDEDVVERPKFRRFYAERLNDVTGISGEGIVVEGVVFSDGWGITHWLDRPPKNEPKTEVWHKPWGRRWGQPDPFTKISGHNGNTVLRWIDKP